MNVGDYHWPASLPSSPLHERKGESLESFVTWETACTVIVAYGAHFFWYLNWVLHDWQNCYVTLWAWVSSQIASREFSVKRSTFSLQTDWTGTGFNPYLYCAWLSSADTTLVENSDCKVFLLNRGIVTDKMSAMSPELGWCVVHSTPLRLLSARLVPCGRACRPVGIDCKEVASCNPLSITLAGLDKCRCQPSLVGNWVRGCWNAWVADRH